MRLVQVPHDKRFIINNKIYVYSLHGNSGNGKIAVFNVTDRTEELLDSNTICILEDDLSLREKIRLGIIFFNPGRLEPPNSII